MDGFTISLALVDFLTVLFFIINAWLMASGFHSLIFAIGAFVCFLAGTGKVIWKLIIAYKNKRIDFFFYQFRYVMPIGFVLMFVGIYVSNVSISNVLSFVICYPRIIFFGLSLLTMIVLLIMANKLNKNNSKHNWIEQLTNIIAQIFILIGLIVK